MEHKITYFLFSLNKEITLKDYNILLSAINTQTGIGIVRNDESRREASIIYGNNPLRADIKFTLKNYKPEPGVKTKIKVPKNRISLTCELADNLTVNFIKEVGKMQGLRVYAPHLGCFLPKDVNLHDCNTGIENRKEIILLEKFGFKPIFWYWNTFTYYALNHLDKKIHIINGHLLRHLMENDVEKVPENFSISIAESLEELVRISNIGILPSDYFECLNRDFKFYNKSGIDLEKLKSKVVLDITSYQYDKKDLEYKKIEKEKILEKEIKRGNQLENIFKEIGSENYTGAIIEREVDYKKVNKKYVPKLNLTVYM